MPYPDHSDLPRALKEYIAAARLNDADTAMLTAVYNRLSLVPMEHTTEAVLAEYKTQDSLFWYLHLARSPFEDYPLIFSDFLNTRLGTTMETTKGAEFKQHICREILERIVPVIKNNKVIWGNSRIEVKKDLSDWRVFLTAPAADNFSHMQTLMITPKHTAIYDVVNGNMINVWHFDVSLPYWDAKLIPMVVKVDSETQQIYHSAHNKADFQTINFTCDKRGAVISQHVV